MLALSKPKVLLTGLPGCGKTTLIKRVVARLDKPVHGFFTNELRRSGGRVGFEVQTFSKPSRKGILSHIDIKSNYRVGKYGVDIETFENIILPEFELGVKFNSLIVIDEIGKMELFSDKFRKLVLGIMDRPMPLLATILSRPHPFCDKLKNIKGLHLITITKNNRDSLIDDITELLES